MMLKFQRNLHAQGFCSTCCIRLLGNNKLTHLIGPFPRQATINFELHRQIHFSLRSLQSAALSPKALRQSRSSVPAQEDPLQWEANAGQVPTKDDKSFKADTRDLTDLCQKQVNHWHSKNSLSEEQISSVMKIAKLAILTRSQGNTTFVKVLHRGSTILVCGLIVEKCFNPELIYLTAQTMFRPIPDASIRDPSITPDIYEQGLMLRRRLFYAGLLAAHIPSALSLWWSIPYDTPAGLVEKNMILKSLNKEKVISLGPKFVNLSNAVRADAVDDVSDARKYFGLIDEEDVSEFELLWKKRVEYMFAMNEEKALATILHGRQWFSAPVIVHSLEQLREYTNNDKMKLRIGIQLISYLPEWTHARIAKEYEHIGDELMAREYHEIAGVTGNKESQAWIMRYLEKMAKLTWNPRRRALYNKQWESWKTIQAKTKATAVAN